MSRGERKRGLISWKEEGGWLKEKHGRKEENLFSSCRHSIDVLNDIYFYFGVFFVY